jgi:hypothetical protein
MTLILNPNSPENTNFLTKQENTDPTSPLNNLSKNIPTLQEGTAGLGANHLVTPLSENERQLAAFERAKKDAAKDDWGIRLKIQDYGITDQNMLFEIAKIVAARKDSRISQDIKEYGITDQSMLFEIAKIAAAHDSQISWHIQNYGLDEDMLFEIVKIAAAHNGKETSQNLWRYCNDNVLFTITRILGIRHYGFWNEDKLFEIAKIAAAHSGRGISEYIHYYGIKDEDKLFEIAKIAAAQNAEGTSYYFKNYGITDQNMLFEIAKIIAAQNGKAISHYIQNFGITDQNMLFEIAKIAAAQDGAGIILFIHKFGITDQMMLFEIAKIAAAQDGAGTSEFIQHYGITDQVKLFEIAKIVAAQNGKAISQHIQRYSLTDQNMRFEIAKIAAAQNGQSTSALIKNYRLSEDQKLQILQLCLAQVTSVALKIGNFYLLEAFAEQQKIPSNEKLFDKIAYTCWLTIPLHFETAEEKKKLEESLKYNFNGLKDFAIKFGASNKVLASFEETIFMKHTSLQQQKKDLVWLGTLLMHYSLDPAKEALKQSPFSDEAMLPLLDCILKTIDPNLRNLATGALIAGYNDSQKMTLLKNLMRELKDERLYLIVLFSTVAGVKTKMTKQVCDELSNSKYKDAKLMAPINELMSALYKSSSLSPEEKERLLGLIFSHSPVKGDRESKPDFSKRLDLYRKSRQNSIAAVHSLLYFGQDEILKNITDTTELVSQWKAFMGETFYIKAEALDKFFPTFGNSKRYPNGLIIFATRLQNLPKEQRDTLMPLLGKFIGGVLDETYPEVRYSFAGNKHLETIFSGNEELLKAWQTSLPIKIDGLESESFTIEDTDAWEDFVLMGTEVDKSCQNIHRDPINNKCLLSSFLDGKIRLMVAREKSSGKIIGRVILRILLDENKKPVLFMEKLYTRNGVNEELISQHIIEGCKQKAQSMGIALTASVIDYYELSANKYPSALESLGGPAPYEYVDAFIDIKKDGIYSIPKSGLVWSPST